MNTTTNVTINGQTVGVFQTSVPAAPLGAGLSPNEAAKRFLERSSRTLTAIERARLRWGAAEVIK